MACGNGCADNCGCCFEDGIATTTHMVGDCWTFDVNVSTDPCNLITVNGSNQLEVKLPDVSLCAYLASGCAPEWVRCLYMLAGTRVL